MANNQLTPKTFDGLQPEDVVKSCDYIEMGSCYALDGVRCCVHGTISSPLIVTAEEVRDKVVTYDLVVQRKRELFAAINDLALGNTGVCKTCANLKSKKFRDVSFEYLGGCPLSAGFNIQHYTMCNQRCAYCCYAVSDSLVKPQYNILDYLELFRKAGKLRGNNWIDFSGGEPAILKNFDEILKYLIDNDLGTVVVYTNATRFSHSIYDALKKNQIIVTTSLDTGIASTYKELRGTDTFSTVLTNLIRYKNSGTRRLWLKYVITERNRTEDDLWSFVLAMLALRPDKIMICPDFPYGEQHVADETVAFAARLWYVLQQTTGIRPVDYTVAFGDPVWVEYRDNLTSAICALEEERPFGDNRTFQQLAPRTLANALAGALTNRVGRIWDSDLRERLVPKGTAREQWVVSMWRKTLGRIL